MFSLPPDAFVDLLIKIAAAASALCQHYKVERCALVTEGGSSLSLLPLHGLSPDWKPITSDLKEFNSQFPGYISSTNGPTMADDKLDAISAKIRAVSNAAKPFDYHFDGPEDDRNLFSRIVRGEVQQWRVWEDARHVAFLTPFANTHGFTVLVPRKHLPSDIFSITGQPFSELMEAAHRVAGCLKEAFGVGRCGMIFEGFEIDYAHVKLIPIHDTHFAADGNAATEPENPPVAPFEETYQGRVTSLNGPPCDDLESLSCATHAMRGLYAAELAARSL